MRERGRDIFRVGEVVGRVYEIRSLLGAGGMGQVFEAQDHALGRRVAIKAAFPIPDAPPLRNEARALAAFRHAGLPVVHALGVHRDIDYIVMERIHGVSLVDMAAHRKASGQPLGIEETVRWMGAVAHALAAVHGAGICHRDVKPANIMLTPDSRIVLMDFGLMTPEFDMGRYDHISGSPPYMSPEALANQVDVGSGPLVDIYALGVTGFELLTGRLPRRSGDVQELWDMSREPVPDVRTLRADVPAALAELLAEMLDRDPGARPQDAEAVAWQLEAVAKGKVSTAGRAPSVLVVDDDPDLARILSFYVEKALGAVELETAKDGLEALERLRAHPPDLMVLDLQMPRMNGIELSMCVRGEGLAEHCRIVCVSAAAEEHDRQLLQQLGIHDVIAKGPGLSDRLAEALRRLWPSRARMSPASR